MRGNSSGNPQTERIATPMFTLGQAAKETGLAKSAISRAIKTGRLSAVRRENGSFEIEPSELFRVYPRNSSGNPQTERTATHSEPNGLQREIGVLRELIEEIRSERDDLRTERDRLLKVIEEQAGSVKQLTHQPKPDPQPAPTPEPQPKQAVANQNPRRSLWATLKKWV